MNLREIKELGLNQVFKNKKIKKKNKQTNKQNKTLFNKSKLACVAIKDNSIILLGFVFDLDFDDIIFPVNSIKIVQNKDKDFLEFKSIMDSLKSYHHIINY